MGLPLRPSFLYKMGLILYNFGGLREGGSVWACPLGLHFYTNSGVCIFPVNSFEKAATAESKIFLTFA